MYIRKTDIGKSTKIRPGRFYLISWFVLHIFTLFFPIIIQCRVLQPCGALINTYFNLPNPKKGLKHPWKYIKQVCDSVNNSQKCVKLNTFKIHKFNLRSVSQYVCFQRIWGVYYIFRYNVSFIRCYWALLVNLVILVSFKLIKHFPPFYFPGDIERFRYWLKDNL